MAPMPNPLTDELTPAAKAELSAVFADLKRQYLPIDIDNVIAERKRPRRRQYWEQWKPL